MDDFRLSVWSPYSGPIPFLRPSHDGSTGLQRIPHGDLRTLLFTWAAPEPPFNGIDDEVRRREIRDLMTDSLDRHRPESERGPEALGRLIETVAGVPTENAKWAGAVSAGDDAEIETEPLRLRGDLAVLQQLRWVLDVFRDVPGVSFSVN